MAAIDLFFTELGSLKVVCLRPRTHTHPCPNVKFFGYFFWMLIFPKPFKVPASYLVGTYPRALAFVIQNHVPRCGPRVWPKVNI